ncbi:MAG: hypothetical protein V4490_07165 [Pseudomonadota bacterium]
MNRRKNKNTDKEGRMRLGNQYANKQWQVTEIEDGTIILKPMATATDKEALVAFNKAFKKHKKTLDSLK